MITCIEFKNKIFETKDDNNIISPATNNMIILCNSSETKDIISDEIERLNDDDGADYGSSSGKDADIKNVIRYKPTSVYDIDNEEQKFIITVEDPYILTAKDKWDIWFADVNKENRIEIYPFVSFIGSEEIWDRGIDRVYKDVLIGRYGNFGRYGR